MERETGIEPATNSLEGCDSTTELLPPSRSPARCRERSLPRASVGKRHYFLPTARFQLTPTARPRAERACRQTNSATNLLEPPRQLSRARQGHRGAARSAVCRQINSATNLLRRPRQPSRARQGHRGAGAKRPLAAKTDRGGAPPHQPSSRPRALPTLSRAQTARERLVGRGGFEPP